LPDGSTSLDGGCALRALYCESEAVGSAGPVPAESNYLPLLVSQKLTVVVAFRF